MSDPIADAYDRQDRAIASDVAAAKIEREQDAWLEPIVIHVHPVVLNADPSKLVHGLQAAREACGQCRNKKPKKFRPLDWMRTKSGG